MLVLRPVWITVPLQPSSIAPFSGQAFSTPLPPVPYRPWLDAEGDTASDNRRSAAALFEDGAPLGPSHALHADIGQDGAGRYSHWNSALIFSSSDGSDPRGN